MLPIPMRENLYIPDPRRTLPHLFVHEDVQLEPVASFVPRAPLGLPPSTPPFSHVEHFEPRTPSGPPPMTPPFFVPRTPSELFECPGTPESVWCVHMSENWMHVYFQRHIVWHFVLPYSAMFDRVWWCETLARNWRCKFSMVQLLPALA